MDFKKKFNFGKGGTPSNAMSWGEKDDSTGEWKRFSLDKPIEIKSDEAIIPIFKNGNIVGAKVVKGDT